MRFNNTEVTKVLFNGVDLTKIRFNGVTVFEKEQYLKQPLTITNTGDRTLPVGIIQTGTAPYRDIEYSRDGSTWMDYALGVTFNIAIGDYIQFRAVMTGDGSSSNYIRFLVGSSSQYEDESADLSGNIMSMWYGSDFIGKDTIPYSYCGYCMFDEVQTIKDITNVRLPATTLKERCYMYMFSGIGITTIPDFPIFSDVPWNRYALYGMFSFCTQIEMDTFTLTGDLGSQVAASMICYGPKIKHIVLNQTEYSSVSDSLSSFARGNTALEDVRTNTSFISDAMFEGCTNLTDIYLLRASVQSLVNVNALSGTGITASTGTIHVPANLLNDYKTATNWVTFADRIVGDL